MCNVCLFGATGNPCLTHGDISMTLNEFERPEGTRHQVHRRLKANFASSYHAVITAF